MNKQTIERALKCELRSAFNLLVWVYSLMIVLLLVAVAYAFYLILFTQG